MPTITIKKQLTQLVQASKVKSYDKKVQVLKDSLKAIGQHICSVVENHVNNEDMDKEELEDGLWCYVASHLPRHTSTYKVKAIFNELAGNLGDFDFSLIHQQKNDENGPERLESGKEKKREKDKADKEERIENVVSIKQILDSSFDKTEEREPTEKESSSRRKRKNQERDEGDKRRQKRVSNVEK